MAEFKFTVKTLIFACLVVAGLQYQTDDGLTLEARLQSFLTSSVVTTFVNDSARGAVKFIKENAAWLAAHNNN